MATGVIIGRFDPTHGLDAQVTMTFGIRTVLSSAVQLLQQKGVREQQRLGRG